LRPIIDLFAFSYMRTCAVYDSTVKSIGFDEIRVRYRQLRRAIMRQVIEKGVVKPKLINFIKAKSRQEIPESCREAFIEDVLEDLEQLDQSRIAGLGITLQQLAQWKEKYSKYTDYD